MGDYSIFGPPRGAVALVSGDLGVTGVIFGLDCYLCIFCFYRDFDIIFDYVGPTENFCSFGARWKI